MSRHTVEIRPSVCLFDCLSDSLSAAALIAQPRCILGLWLLQKTNRKPTLEVEPIGQRGRTATGVAETATKPLLAPLSKHSLGDATCQVGAVWQCRLGQLRYATTSVWTCSIRTVARYAPVFLHA